MKQLSNEAMTNTHFESLYPDNSREHEIKQILGYIKEGNSCQIVGLPGAGRSTLLGLLSYNHNVRVKNFGENQKWYHFVLCNFSEIRKKPLLEAEKYLLLSLLDSLRERKFQKEYAKVNEIFKESIGFKDELVMFQGLKKTIDFLAIEKELTIVFLFDRFEEYIPILTPDFFANLRILRGRAKYRFSVVFSLNRPLEDLIEPTFFTDFYEFVVGHIIYLPLIDKPGLDFRIAYLEKAVGKKINPKIIKKILELTAGHGKLTRLSLETILASSNQSLASSKELGDYLLDQKIVRSSLYEIWHSLTPEEQETISHLPEADNGFLEKIGLIKNGKIALPLFQEFANQQFTKEQKNQKIIFDISTNEIKKGSVVISEKLTSLEFRLLKFFIENPNRIIERDEVINAVWKDIESTAGVTDQALDQLIFRVRQKIESDPNHPQHLETIKGRGFKFTP